MGEKIQYIIYVICLLFMAGCAALPPVEIPVGERTFNKPYDVVWNRTVESLPRAGEAVIWRDAEVGSIVIERPIQGCDLLFDDFIRNWYYGTIRVNIFIDRTSTETAKALVEVSFIELYDVSRGLLDVLGSAEVFREEVLFTNLSTAEHYLDYIENAVYRDKLSKRTFWGRIGWAIEDLPTKTSWGW